MGPIPWLTISTPALEHSWRLLQRLRTSSLATAGLKEAAHRSPGGPWLLPAMAMLLVLMLVATEVAGFLFTSHHQRLLIELRNDTREMRIVQQALVDQKESAEDYVQHRDSKSLIAFSEAARTLSSYRATALQRLDRLAQADGSPPPSRAVLALQGAWARSVAAANRGSGREAQNLLSRADTRRALRELRRDISRYLEIRNGVGSSYEERILIGGNIVLG